MVDQCSLSALPNSLPLATAVRGRSLQSTIARIFGRFALHALAVSLLALSIAVPGFAATDTVTSLADDGSAGTLRSVIAAAASGDTITFSVSGIITLILGQLELSQNLTISGPGAANLAISGNSAFTVFQVDPQVTAAVSGVTIENGNGGYASAGAILNDGTLTVSSSTLSGNSAYFFGSILNEGTLTVSSSTLSGNSSSYYVGGIFNDGTLTVSNSTLSGNSAYYAGGIWMNQGTLTVSNSTLSGNSGHFAGGIFNNGAMTLKNTLLASQSSGGNCDLYRGSATSDGYNLDDDGSCGLNQAGDQSGVTNAANHLGPLQNNGGPTQTIALLAGSTAIDAIPLSVCSDAFGNPVSTDQRGITRPQGSGCDIGAFELAQMPTANVCTAGQTTPAPCSYTITLQYNIPPGTTFGASPVKVVTQGTPNLDFTLASTTCTGSPASCIAQVTFAPLAPGVRMGAVQLTDTSGNVLSTTMVQGIGQGPAIAFGPGVQTTVGSGLSGPSGAALDAVGDVFIVDGGNNRVVEVPAGGGAQTTVGSGLSGPSGVAVDGEGDVFIADSGNNRVVEVPAGGGAQTTVPASGLNGPYGVAVDGAGNVFIADSYNQRVVEVPAGGGAQITVGSGLSYPRGVAVDGAGDVFIVNEGSFQVVEVPAGGGPQTTVGSGLNHPFGVAVDGAGDVFIADSYNSRVLEVPAGGGPQTTVGSGVSLPLDVAVDGAGNLFIPDFNNNQVVEVQRSQPPALSFAPTVWGTTSSDSPQSVTIQNIGNQPLNAVGPGLVDFSSDFPWVAGSGTPPDCTSNFSLAPGAICNLSISFRPQHIAALTYTATVTDNTLNANLSATQIIALQGTGQPVTFQVTIGTYPSGLAFVVDGVSYSSAQSFTWTNGSSHTIATVSPQTPVAGTQYAFANWSDGGALSHSVTASVNSTAYTAMFSTQYMLTTAVSPVGGGTVSTPSGYQAAGSSVPLVATPSAGYVFSSWTGNVANANSPSTSVTMSAPETITANFINTTTTGLVLSLNPSTFGQSVTFAATVTPTGGGTTTGTVTFTDGPNVLGTVSLSGGQAALSTSALAAGSHSIVASYAGDPNHQPSTSAARLQTVQTASTTLGIASNLNPSVYNQAATFTASITPKFSGSATGTVTFFDVANASTLGAAPVSGNQATLNLSTLPVGTGEITAFYSGDSNFTESTSHVLDQIVKKASTTTALTSSLNPALVGQTVRYTATVTTQYLGTANGTVNFESGGAALGSATLVKGQASINVSFSTSGNRSITAKYVGDVNNTASTSPALKQVVSKYSSTTTVVSSANPSIVGEVVGFTATIATSGSPTGTVTFKSGGVTLGTVTLSGNTANLSTSTLAAGTHSIEAVYSGDATFAASTSAALKQVVNKP